MQRLVATIQNTTLGTLMFNEFTLERGEIAEVTYTPVLRAYEDQGLISIIRIITLTQ